MSRRHLPGKEAWRTARRPDRWLLHCPGFAPSLAAQEPGDARATAWIQRRRLGGAARVGRCAAAGRLLLQRNILASPFRETVVNYYIDGEFC
ncbi:hypothetical protein CHELA20_52885 [Hyphomicrobiales bacterium]|nr:hypothetical protein CHELA41_22041 [Hyphomicrobiales bacterium]CAH1683144.1 hypothetical protein CHELA20_52885 [Hyphomicrobiales bacterium]